MTKLRENQFLQSHNFQGELSPEMRWKNIFTYNAFERIDFEKNILQDLKITVSGPMSILSTRKNWRWKLEGIYSFPMNSWISWQPLRDFMISENSVFR